MLSDWVSFLAYPNLFGIKGSVVVVVFALGTCLESQHPAAMRLQASLICKVSLNL
jgi:hypothetical protein